MKKHIVITLCLATLLVSACGDAPEETAMPAGESGTATSESSMNTTGETSQELYEAAKDTASEAGEASSEAYESAKESTSEAYEATKEAGETLIQDTTQ